MICFCFLLLQTYKLLCFISEELIHSLFRAGFSFLLSVNTYDWFACGLPVAVRSCFRSLPWRQVKLLQLQVQILLSFPSGGLSEESSEKFYGLLN